ncbi:MAG TPA: VTT domain-containing protein [Bryobacteraceae bacterium]|nr:VTT domain-containing protein [Bryobacteraceae bacterium]
MIHALIEFLRTLTNPERLIHLLSTLLSGWLGYTVLFGVVFAETGLLVGFFFPGDSLLFTVGVVAGAGQLNIVVVNLLLMAAAIAGDTTGFLLGRKTGPIIFDRPDSRFFKREHLRRTHEFYERYGGKTIVYARFVPIVRTFAPFVAGVARMNYLHFLSYNIFGGIGWVFLMTMLGYGLGGVPIVRQYFDKVILLIVVLSLLPTAIEIWKAWRRKGALVAVPGTDDATPTLGSDPSAE